MVKKRKNSNNNDEMALETLIIKIMITFKRQGKFMTKSPTTIIDI